MSVFFSDDVVLVIVNDSFKINGDLRLFFFISL